MLHRHRPTSRPAKHRVQGRARIRGPNAGYRISGFDSEILRIMKTLVTLASCLLGCAFAAAAQPDDRIDARPGLFKSLTEPPCSYCANQNLKGLVRPDDRVLAWLRGVHNGGAFPLRFFIAGSRVINDTYGLFFYDPDGGYVAAYKKDYGYEFYGWRNGVMVVKGRDGTIWSALTGAAISGPQKGKRLERVPSMVTNWTYWLMLHPESTAYDLFDGKKYTPVDLPVGMSPDARKSIGRVDPRLDESRIVLGVENGPRSMAFPLDIRQQRACQTDRVGDTEVAVLWYGPTQTAVAFETNLEGRHLTFYADEISPETAPFKDKETGTRWSPAGRGIDGPLRGKELTWVNSIQCRWYAWSAEYPATDIATNIAPSGGAPQAATRPTIRGEVLAPNDVTPQGLARFTRQRANTVVIRVDDDRDTEAILRAVRRVRAARLRPYYWFDVGRNRTLADAHPEWMASLQGHPEWRRYFPKLPQAKEGEVVKSYPWVPVRYEAAFEAHVQRLAGLLKALPRPDGLFLDHLQASPSACGCGNLLCRWTPDYGPVKTATDLPPNAASQFLAAASRLAPGTEVIPVWSTECEEHEMAKDAECCGVHCFSGTCWIAWSEQLRSVSRQARIIGVPSYFRASGRTDPAWVEKTIASFAKMPPMRQGEPVLANRLVALLQGWNVQPAEIEAQERAAVKSGAAGWLVVRTPLDESWSPRIVRY